MRNKISWFDELPNTSYDEIHSGSLNNFKISIEINDVLSFTFRIFKATSDKSIRSSDWIPRNNVNKDAANWILKFYFSWGVFLVLKFCFEALLLYLIREVKKGRMAELKNFQSYLTDCSIYYVKHVRTDIMFWIHTMVHNLE